ncbi:MAG: RNA polymerase sigma factor [Rhizobiales bacterium]|nr:RNA polymerase sigma factor [Hyphomicrobiales bacterium]
MSRTDHDAVKADLALHLEALWRYGLVLSRNRDTAEDLVQATCVRALERSHQFLPGTRLDRWLFAIQRSIWINELRSQRVRQGAGIVDAEIALVVDGRHEIETNILASQVLREGVPIGTVMSRLATVRERLGGLSDATERREETERGGDDGH